nr:MAG TPA_asm: hypothetical protein [Caudoviricetes sp.]
MLPKPMASNSLPGKESRGVLNKSLISFTPPTIISPTLPPETEFTSVIVSSRIEISLSQ